MSKQTKTWLIIAASLVVVGCVVFGGIMMALKWDFSKLSTAVFETQEYEVAENYKNISIETNAADIVLVPSQDGKCSVVCYERENVKHSVLVKDDALMIRVIDMRKWYEHIEINFGQPKITVYLPAGEYSVLSVKSDTGDVEIPQDFKFQSVDISVSTGDVKNFASASGSLRVKTSTGDIYAQNISADSLELSVSTGKVTAENVNCFGDISLEVSTGKAGFTNIACKNLTSRGNTGDLLLQNVVATEKFLIERTTGNVRFDGCDAAELIVKTDTGDVTGTLLTDKIFMTQTDTGRVDVPKTTNGGKCEITTDTGNIKIQIK